MQNNVTELTQRLLRALDSNYNVIDMPAVIEIVSLLEKVTITKELLETTRLGKHVNELRRKTDNDSLSKRAKELVRKWRNMVLSESNGQLKSQPSSTIPEDERSYGNIKKRPPPPPSVSITTPSSSNDGGGGGGGGGSTTPPPPPQKRPKMNGQQQTMGELDFSDNSNSSFKDFKKHSTTTSTSSVICLNSDSNSSVADPQIQQRLDGGGCLVTAEPKKRGRKKGSKNHKNLIDEAETSFSNKLAVSRGNSKVKTTQELIAGLQNKTLAGPNGGGGNTSSSSSSNQSGLAAGGGKSNKEDLTLRAAKLTERVSIIDQKLNTTNRFKQKNRNKFNIPHNNDRVVIESGSVINDKSLFQRHNRRHQHLPHHLLSNNQDDEIIVVDDVIDSSVRNDDDSDDDDDDTGSIYTNDISNVKTDGDGDVMTTMMMQPPKMLSLSVEEARALLPPIDSSIFDDIDDDVSSRCTCTLKTIDDDTDDPPVWIDDPDCMAKRHLDAKYRSGRVTIDDLHTKCLEGVNGNYGCDPSPPGAVVVKATDSDDDGCYANVVPNVNSEIAPKENYKKYSISEETSKVAAVKIEDGCDGDEPNAGAVEVGGCDGGDDRTQVGDSDDVIIKNDVSNNNNNDDSCGGDVSGGLIFREWHHVLDTPSYNGEMFKILPYVIID